MRLPFLAKLACPFDKHDLDLKVFSKTEEEIMEGILTCQHCQRYYPIIQGIPIMSPDEYREVKLEQPILERWGEALAIEDGKTTFQLSSNVNAALS